MSYLFTSYCSIIKCVSLANKECHCIPFSSMSSPPTPNTSIKNVNLSSHKKQRHPSAFAFITAFNLFHKRPTPKSPAPTSVEPYEVAPGIWNTDATARAFGYVDSDGDTKFSKSKSCRAKIDSCGQSQIPERKPVPVHPLIVQSEEIYAQDSTNILDKRTPRNHTDSQGQSGREHRSEAEKLSERARRQDRRTRMRTVDDDDRLTVRGANPRTGIVSPAFVSDNSDSNPAEDHKDIQKIPMQRARSGKWKAEGQGWSLVESPRLSPIPQSTHEQPSRQVSMRDLQDKLLLEMPGVDNPNPENMTDQKMWEYQRALAKIHKNEGSDAMVDPTTLPSPRTWTPERPSTPPTRLHKLARRKQVGSEIKPSDESIGTVVQHKQKRTSSVPTLRKEEKERPHQNRVRIVTPSNTPRDSSLETRIEERTRISTEDLF